MRGIIVGIAAAACINVTRNRRDLGECVRKAMAARRARVAVEYRKNNEGFDAERPRAEPLLTPNPGIAELGR
jgi:hypothetical protein